jgi:hypothetical protein
MNIAVVDIGGRNGYRRVRASPCGGPADWTAGLGFRGTDVHSDPRGPEAADSRPQGRVKDGNAL